MHLEAVGGGRAACPQAAIGAIGTSRPTHLPIWPQAAIRESLRLSMNHSDVSLERRRLAGAATAALCRAAARSRLMERTAVVARGR
jgi:hypothetical protein